MFRPIRQVAAPGAKYVVSVWAVFGRVVRGVWVNTHKRGVGRTVVLAGKVVCNDEV